MRILLADPAADWSTRDVFVGLRDGLRENGHAVIEFRTGRLLSVMMRALRLQAKAEKAAILPSPADAAYLASQLCVTWALRHEPDWVIVVSGMYFHPDAFVLMRRAGIKTAVLLTETPYDIPKEQAVAAVADVVWTNERTAVDAFRTVNPRTFYLPHAYNTAVHRPDANPRFPETPAHDVVFIGTGFQERVELLRGVDWTGIDLGLYGAWPLVTRRSPLHRHVREGIIDNDRAGEFYRRAAVNLNLFRTSMGFGRHVARITGSESLGPRAYELAACGAFFVSERRAEVLERFGDLVPTFETPDEMQSVLRRWLSDAPGRRRIAAALPAAVRGHSWTVRARQVVADLERAVAGCDRLPTNVTARDASTAAIGEPSGTGALAVV